jgi:acetyl esterase/lipase
MSAGAALMRWPDLLSRPMPHADERIATGSLPQTFGELWLPGGAPEKARLVILIHGGCWTKSVADLSIMNWAADALRRKGYAVFNLEYRGVDEPGGGYPGTYLDVAAGVDRAMALVRERGLDPRPPVLAGHSAGGHLALWAAARRKLPPASPLRAPEAAPVAGVIDLAGIANLKTDLETACGADPVRAMAGRPGPGRADVYADTSPAALAPLGVPTVVLHGREDETVPLAIGEAYAARARAQGDKVEILAPPGGHVEEISPGTEAFAAFLEALKTLAPP